MESAAAAPDKSLDTGVLAVGNSSQSLASIGLHLLLSNVDLLTDGLKLPESRNPCLLDGVA